MIKRKNGIVKKSFNLLKVSYVTVGRTINEEGIAKITQSEEKNGYVTLKSKGNVERALKNKYPDLKDETMIITNVEECKEEYSVSVDDFIKLAIEKGNVEVIGGEE